MFNLFGRSNLYNIQNRDFDTIRDLVQSGLSEMRKNPNEANFSIWFNYSQKILALINTKNPTLVFNYSTFGSTLLTANIPTYEKYSKCIDYLLEIMKYV